MHGAELKDTLAWFSESLTPYMMFMRGAVEVVEVTRTKFQHMAIVELGDYGKALILDHHCQTTVHDEVCYHEPLVHIPMISHAIQHGLPKKVLILGGGDGGALREVLRWKSVEQAVMVDIDGEVVEACKKHLPEIHQGSFDDPRADVRIADAFDLLEASKDDWDVIVCDFSDPLEDSPAYRVFTKEFFAMCHNALTPHGQLTIQAGPATPPMEYMHGRLISTLKASMPYVTHFVSCTPTYIVPLGFGLASRSPLWERVDVQAIDDLLASALNSELRMLDGLAIQGLFSTPKYLRKAVAEETMVYSVDSPAMWYATESESI